MAHELSNEECGLALKTVLVRNHIGRHQVAERLGVSVDTVNNWCSGRSTMRVSHLARLLSLLVNTRGDREEIRSFVLRLLLEEGLSVEASVQLLPMVDNAQRTRWENTVLYVAPQVLSKGNRLAALGARVYLAGIGSNILLVSADQVSGPMERGLADLIIKSHVRAVMLSRLRSTEWIRVVLEAADEAGAPVVALYQKGGLQGKVRRFVWIDDISIGYDVGTYLVNAGQVRIGFLGIDVGSPSEQARYEGFSNSLSQSGISLDMGNVFWDSAAPMTEPSLWVADEFDPQPKTIECVRRLQEGSMTAVFCASEPATIALVHAANTLGVPMPVRGTWQVVGTALSSWPDLLFGWRFPYVRIPGYEIGRQAAKLATIEGLSDDSGIVYEGLVECDFRNLR